MLRVKEEISVCTIVSVRKLICVVDVSFLPQLVSHTALEVDVSNFKQSLIQIVVNRTSAALYLVRMSREYMSERLPFFINGEISSSSSFNLSGVVLMPALDS